MFCSVCVVSASVFLVLLLLWLWKHCGTSTLKCGERVILITAHPDDECMFFSPTILSLAKQKKKIFLLCLSEGDFYGKGNVRRQELFKSTSILGVYSNNVEIVDDRKLPDNPHVEWSVDIIEKYLLESIKQHGIETVITFDEAGVSGHSNHSAIARTIRELHQKDVLKKAGVTEVLLLDTLHTLRKYASWFDVMWTLGYRKPRWYACSNMAGCFKAKAVQNKTLVQTSKIINTGKLQAMLAHSSQVVWFRRLYIAFSRYLIINTFTRLHQVRQ